MNQYTNDTHEPSLQSWVESANDPATDFPIQNLPYGVFTRDDLPEDLSSHVGVAIGDRIFDITQAIEEDVLDIDDDIAADFFIGCLNEFMSNERETWGEVRAAISTLLRHDNVELRDDAELRDRIVIPMANVEMELPAVIGDYTDFYASIHHATNIGSMFRPDNPLLPNYVHIPIGYHGRASSIVISGTPVRRPMGQTLPADAESPAFGPCRLLDYELEMGFFVGGGNEQGARIPMSEIGEHLFGMCIVNDWSARDIQKWEYQPLGPFNAKNFATSISPWVVTLDALAPFRAPGPYRGDEHPQPLEYLQSKDDWGINITVEVWLRSETMRSSSWTRPDNGAFEIDSEGAALISRGNFRDMYWTIAQMLVHHASGGCNMEPGDLLASGTISGTDESSRGCLLERTWRGEQPIDLPDGTQRKLLQDGDEVIIRAYCEKDGARRIGFGECRGIVLPAE